MRKFIELYFIFMMSLFGVILLPQLIGWIIAKGIRGPARRFLYGMFENRFDYSNYWVLGVVTIMVILVLGMLDFYFWNLFTNSFGASID